MQGSREGVSGGFHKPPLGAHIIFKQATYLNKQHIVIKRAQLWVIPGEINKEFRLTFRISTKFGMLIAYIEVITHIKF